jgi:hypothetical protein
MLEIPNGLRKRPDCQGCNKKESALMLIRGLFLCGDCVVKLQNAQKENILKIVQENGNQNRQDNRSEILG